MTRTTDNGTGPSRRPAWRPPDGLRPDLTLYERLIDDGLAAADAQDTIVDHVTARRLALWLAARPQPPGFARSLAYFTQTGSISPELRTQMRVHARSGNHPDGPQIGRLLSYAAQRREIFGPIDRNFARDCDQIDRADAMLAQLRERTRQSRRHPEPAPPGNGEPRIIALAHRDPGTQTVTFTLDAATASTALFAIAAHADEREAHVREVQRFGQSLPEDSYGRHNRQAIAARETRLAVRLRAIEHAYRTATERDAVLRPPEPSMAFYSLQHASDREMELE
jgi:hypothetical protein